MPVFSVYNLEGKAVAEVERPELFQQPASPSLINRYYTWVRSMIRPTISHTKTRGDVSGGGKKPWKQKGTGRARVGSSRSPLWRHGGTVFGPLKVQNWHTRMPRTERRKALLGALSAKAELNKVAVLDTVEIATPRTKDMKSLLQTIPETKDGKVLHIHHKYEAPLFNATRNLPGVTSKSLSYMSIIDILNHDALVMSKDTLEALKTHFE